MSLHIGALIVRGDARAELPGLCASVNYALSDEPAATEVHFDDPSGRDGQCAIGLVDGWTVVWGRSDLLAPPLEHIAKARDPQLYATADHLAPALAGFSRGRELYFSISDGTAGAYGIDHYVDGHRQRSLWELERELVHDEGRPLPHEKESMKRLEVDEWGMVELLCHLTVPYATLESCLFDIWRITWVPSVRKRPWWRLW